MSHVATPLFPLLHTAPVTTDTMVPETKNIALTESMFALYSCITKGPIALTNHKMLIAKCKCTRMLVRTRILQQHQDMLKCC